MGLLRNYELFTVGFACRCSAFYTVFLDCLLFHLMPHTPNRNSTLQGFNSFLVCDGSLYIDFV
jgi:hypothetical protein